MSTLTNTHTEQGGVYVGLWAAPTTLHIPVLLAVALFHWIHPMTRDILREVLR